MPNPANILTLLPLIEPSHTTHSLENTFLFQFWTGATLCGQSAISSKDRALPTSSEDRALPNSSKDRALPKTPKIELSLIAPKIELTLIAPKIELSLIAPKIELSLIAPKFELSFSAVKIELGSIAPKIELLRYSPEDRAPLLQLRRSSSPLKLRRSSLAAPEPPTTPGLVNSTFPFQFRTGCRQHSEAFSPSQLPRSSSTASLSSFLHHSSQD